MKKREGAPPLAYVALGALTLVFMFPFAWMFDTSLKLQPDIYKSPPVWIPRHATLQNFNAFLQVKFGIYFANSLAICGLSMVIIVALACLAAYGFSRYRFAGREILLSVSLMGQLLPTSVLFVPFYMMFGKIGLIDTRWSLVTVYVVTTLPFGIWLLTEYLDSIPRSLDEACIIDGASALQVMLRVVFPVAIPGIITVAFYSFTHCWQEFLFANIFISTVEKRTLPLGLIGFQGEYHIDWGAIMAVSLTMTLPTTILFVAFQKKIIPGLTGGAIKG
jgi:multiple sugar transport system permease protein